MTSHPDKITLLVDGLQKQFRQHAALVGRDRPATQAQIAEIQCALLDSVLLASIVGYKQSAGFFARRRADRSAAVVMERLTASLLNSLWR